MARPAPPSTESTATEMASSFLVPAASRTRRGRGAANLVELRFLGEALAVILFTWLALGWTPAAMITQSDGSTLVAPYLQSALAGGADWAHHLYRFGVIGGSDMHDFAGTMPIVQVCCVLGLSVTATATTIVIFVQVCLAFFGRTLIEAWIAQWSPAGAGRVLTAPQRIVTIWLCAFAPALGWRLAIGHDNLLLGLLPFVATLALFASARAGTLTATALGVGWFAVCNGITGLGAQTVMYGAIFGAPIVLVTILGAPHGARWGRPQWAVTAALAAAVLVAMPRLFGMLHHAVGEDASRGLDALVTYSFGAGSWADWLTSIPWTKHLAAATVGTDSLHEHNYPLGPLVLFVVVAWPRGAGRGVLWAMLASTALAIAFADRIEPVSSALIAIVRPLAAFRVPSRAVLPVLVTIAPLALAALWTPRNRSWAAAPVARTDRVEWLVLVASAAIVPLGRDVAIAREVVAWLACAALAASTRWPPFVARARQLAPVIAVVAALGVTSFGDRLFATFVTDTVDEGPRRVHDAVVAQAPDLHTALDRIEIAGAPPPYAMSEAFAARLPSLDGVWYPPSRFLALISALLGHEVPPTTCVFDLAGSRPFPVLQQLYNVKYLISLRRGGRTIETLPETPGAAWFPATLMTTGDPGAMARDFAAHPLDLRGVARETGWLLARDAAHLPALSPDPACRRAQVTSVTTDELGQVATIAVTSPADCALVVATNYVTTLHATAGPGSSSARELPVFPIDIALTGIAVPAGTWAIELAPRADCPGWTWIAAAFGALLLAAALVVLVPRRASP